MLINANIQGDKDRGEKIARRPKTAPRPCQCSLSWQLWKTSRAFSHYSSGYQANSCVHV